MSLSKPAQFIVCGDAPLLYLINHLTHLTYLTARQRSLREERISQVEDSKRLAQVLDERLDLLLIERPAFGD